MNLTKSFILLFIATFLVAQDYSGYDWDEEYQRVYNDDYSASNLKRREEWKEIAPNIKSALEIMRPKIHEMALVYGVDPRAVVGSIVTENSINIGIEDRLQQFLVDSGAASDGSFMGKEFSFGWGQLYTRAAMEADKIIAKKENRDPYPREEVSRRLKIPEEAMKYAAALIRHHQDNYLNCECNQAQENRNARQEGRTPKKCGIDISDRPDLLATLYNLGNSERYCKITMERMRNGGAGPRFNFFGMFVAMKIDEIEEIVGQAEEDKEFSFALSGDDNLREVLVDVGENSRFEDLRISERDTHVPTPKPPKSGFEQLISFFTGDEEEKVDPNEPKHLAQIVQVESGLKSIMEKTPEFEAIAFKEEITGYRMPRFCLGGNADTESMKTIKLKPNLPIVSSSKIINCGTSQWLEVTLSDGTSAWVQKSDVLFKTKEASKVDVKCSSSISGECKQKIKYALGIDLESSSQKGGIVYKIKNVKNGDYESPSCKDFKPREEFNESYSEALGIITHCTEAIKGYGLSLGASFLEIQNKLPTLDYIRFSDIEEELTNISTICKTYEYIKNVEQNPADGFNLENATCDNGINPFAEVNEVLEWKMNLVTAFYLGQGQEGVESALVDELDTLKSKLVSFENPSNIPKCNNYWRDKTKSDILKVARTGCVTKIEVPFLSIASDFKNGSLIYLKKSIPENEIIFKTSPAKCEEE